MFIVGNSDTLQRCSRVLLSEFSTIVMGEVAVREILQETLEIVPSMLQCSEKFPEKNHLKPPQFGYFSTSHWKKAKTGAVEHQLAPSRMTAR